MLAQDLRRDLSRRFYVRSRTARSAALRIAYLAYARTLSRWYRLGRERNQSSEINFSISSGTCEPAIRRPRHPRDI